MSFISVLRQTGLAILTASLAAGAVAQTPASAAPSASVRPTAKPVTHKKKRIAKSAPPAQVVVTRPPDPPPPDWPANDAARAASVEWNGRELSIAASNSTLKQILHDVSTATGLKVDGMGNDQRADARVYGSYGPAPAQEVLSELLEGSGYNVLMIGDQGEGNPRELLLTAKLAHGSATSQGPQGRPGARQQPQEEEAPEEPEQPEPPQPLPNRPIGNPQQDQGKTPQQVIQEMQQQRIQQLQQQQQQQQSGQPPAYNPNPN